MTRITANDGDRLDLICWRLYGTLSSRIVEQVLDSNPGLSMYTELAAGVSVYLPEISEASQLERSLW